MPTAVGVLSVSSNVDRMAAEHNGPPTRPIVSGSRTTHDGLGSDRWLPRKFHVNIGARQNDETHRTLAARR